MMKLELFTTLMLLTLLLSKIYMTILSVQNYNKYPVGDINAKKISTIVFCVLFSLAFLYLMFSRSKSPRSISYIVTTVILFLSAIFMTYLASDLAYIISEYSHTFSKGDMAKVIIEDILIFIIAIAAFVCGGYRTQT